ncbi:SET domain-containing protein [Planctomycetota bacterium]
MNKSWMSRKVRVAPNSVRGRGIVAFAHIVMGEPILVWGGAGYTNAAGVQHNKAVMQWDDNVFSCEVGGEDEEPFLVNHSCDPNAWMSDAFTICARRDIGPGEEITADYALWEADESYVSPWVCRCGSQLCRGRVTGTDWKDPNLQKRYRSHFSPLLNKRIERDGR